MNAFDNSEFETHSSCFQQRIHPFDGGELFLFKISPQGKSGAAGGRSCKSPLDINDIRYYTEARNNDIR